MARHPVPVSVGSLFLIALGASAGLAQPPVPKVAFDMIQYGDGTPDGERTRLEATGHLTVFDAGEGRPWLNRVEVFGTRHGSEGAPAREFHLHVIGLDGAILREVTLPYSIWELGTERWHSLPIPPIRVPREFGVGLTFGSTSDEGVRVGIEQVTESHSYAWAPGSEGRGLWDIDWMIRVRVDAEPAGDPEARDLIILDDGRAFFDRVASAGGDPPVVQAVGAGTLRRDQIAVIRMNAACTPQAQAVLVTLAGGAVVQGRLVSLSDRVVRLRDEAGTEHEFPRSQIAKLDFRRLAPKRIAAQTEPPRPKRAWGPEQATGPPDTPQAGDVRTAWAPAGQNDGAEWLRLDYENAVSIAEVRVRETYNPGAVCRVTAALADGTEAVLWEGEDPTTNAPEDFVVQVTDDVMAKSVTVYLDTSRRAGWNEIDAVELVGKEGTRQWAVRASASSTYAERHHQPVEIEVLFGKGEPMERAVPTGAAWEAR